MNDAPHDHTISVRSIGLLRALPVGGLMCAVPVFRALRRAHPEARLTLIGLPWAAEWVTRSPYLDDFIEFPGYPGLGGESPPRVDALPGFLSAMQAREFDLLLQVHDDGQILNPLLAACGARRLGGFWRPGAWRPASDAFLPWPAEGHETERLLALMDHLGVPRQGLRLEFPLADEDRRTVAAQLQDVPDSQPLIVLHMGHPLPTRRWLPERFAQVGDALAARGNAIVIAGSEEGRALATAVSQLMQAPTVNVVGQTTLWTLGALLERVSLLVCNDTRVSHIASALGTPSVVISSGTDVARWAPLEAARHPVLWEPVDDDDERPATSQAPDDTASASPRGAAHPKTISLPAMPDSMPLDPVLATVQALETPRP